MFRCVIYMMLHLFNPFRFSVNWTHYVLREVGPLQQRKPQDLGHRIHLIDGYDLGMPGRTGTYVIDEEQLTIIETGPSPSVPYILEGLKQLQLNTADVKYIIVTHIHLDHAGGAGRLLQHCPNAEVIVHPRGARHLADPSRLIAGARAVYGEKFDQLFDPVVPVPEDRLVIKEDGDTLSIGANRTLHFWDTPGHAAHHFSMYDPVSNGIFAGDNVGIRFHHTEDVNVTFYIPSTSPNQFDPEAMMRSMQKFRESGAERLYLGHFGMTSDVEQAYEQVSDWIPRFVEQGKEALAENEGVEGIVKRLSSMMRQYLTERGVPEDHDVYKILEMDLKVCAMGIIDYLQKQQR